MAILSYYIKYCIIVFINSLHNIEILQRILNYYMLQVNENCFIIFVKLWLSVCAFLSELCIDLNLYNKSYFVENDKSNYIRVQINF